MKKFVLITSALFVAICVWPLSSVGADIINGETFNTMRECMQRMSAITTSNPQWNGQNIGGLSCRHRSNVNYTEVVPGAEIGVIAFSALPNVAATGTLPSVPSPSTFRPWTTVSPLVFPNMQACFQAVRTHLDLYHGQTQFDHVQCVRQSQRADNTRTELRWDPSGGGIGIKVPPPPGNFRPWVNRSPLEFPTIIHCRQAIRDYIIPHINDMSFPGGVRCVTTHMSGKTELRWQPDGDGTVIPPPPTNFNPLTASPPLLFPTINHCMRAINTHIVPFLNQAKFTEVRCSNQDLHKARAELYWRFDKLPPPPPEPEVQLDLNHTTQSAR